MCGSRRVSLVVLVSALAPAAPAFAEPIVAGQFTVPVTVTQSVELFPGTPFNPGPTSITVLAEAVGSLTVTHQAQVGSTILTQPLARLAGVFPSPLPPIPYEILAGTPDLPASRGVISNVVQNPAHPGFPAGDPSSFVSGDFREEAFFKVVLADGTTIYTDPNRAAILTALLTGLPYPPGTAFTSPGRINLYLQTGPGLDPSRDPVIGQTFNRTLAVTGSAAVPEPSTAALLALGSLGLLRYGRKRTPAAAR